MDWSKHFPKEGLEYSGRWVRNWFSNMAPSEFELDGKMWKSVENYYQAMKSLDPEEQEFIRLAPINKSKMLGRDLKIREDWEEVKFEIMCKALKAKFNLEPYKSQLLNTGDDIIIEWNNWGDKIWGVTINDMKGSNLLGVALMTIRDNLKRH